MDIYYFYNGINNIIKLALKDKKYVANSKLILNDPLVILDFQYSSNLKGGTLSAVKAALQSSQGQKLAKDTISKGEDAAKENNKNESSDTKDGEPNSTNTSNNEDEDPKEKALKIIKVLFTIVYYLCLFAILPLLPFIAISYYSFKRLKIFYNEQMGTL
jgi:hypothetical protein